MFGYKLGMDMGMIFELIFTVHKRNKTLGVTQFFFSSAEQALRFEEACFNDAGAARYLGTNHVLAWSQSSIVLLTCTSAALFISCFKDSIARMTDG
jgi:hypothetical protein